MKFSSNGRASKKVQTDTSTRQPRVLPADRLDALFGALKAQGHQLIGPTIRDGGIIYDEIQGASDLPQGWGDEQAPGSYRLVRRTDAAYFGYNVGPQSWKKLLHLPKLTLFRASASKAGWKIDDDPPQEIPRMAFIGVRSCELRAIFVQDRVLMGDAYVDPHYAARREKLFIVAVQCGQAGATCFCVSMNSGPRAADGFDLALTELIDPGRHLFLVEVGSEKGAEVLRTVPTEPAGPDLLSDARDLLARTAAHMGRQLEYDGVKELLYHNLEHTRWDDVAKRCLSCGNCTVVCPTCFCTAVEDTTSLARDTETGGTASAERTRRWDSCFTMDHSYLHGGSVRASTRGRYRLWLIHKLATWQDQFGSSGCVGCGRCITWCPVGIDITEEVAAIRATDGRNIT